MSSSSSENKGSGAGGGGLVFLALVCEPCPCGIGTGFLCIAMLLFVSALLMVMSGELVDRRVERPEGCSCVIGRLTLRGKLGRAAIDGVFMSRTPFPEDCWRGDFVLGMLVLAVVLSWLMVMILVGAVEKGTFFEEEDREGTGVELERASEGERGERD